jgi:hypothetical protein
MGLRSADFCNTGWLMMKGWITYTYAWFAEWQPVVEGDMILLSS